MTDQDRETILVVYDSQAIRDTLSVLDLGNGYRIVELDDPGRLMDVFEDEDPGLVLMCAMTRNSSAFERCADLKKAILGGFVPVVIYSLRTGQEEREKACEAGADDLIQVTISPEELQGRIASLLRMRGVVVEAQRRTASIARASAEAADMMLQLEEADRRIREQNAELERMVHELEERDKRISAQQKEIEKHLATLRKEVELAATLQMSLLPEDLPRMGDLAIYDRYIPAAELCGDYYDYLCLDDGSLVAFIADVTGHGVAPALVSVQVRTLARTLAQSGASPAEILEKLNDFMYTTFRRDFLMTMVCVHCRPGDGKFVFSNAGHPPLVVVPPESGEPCSEVYGKGCPLGVIPGGKFVNQEIELVPGSRILLYTDGIIELSADGGETFFGNERLVDNISASRDLGGQAQLDKLLADVRSYCSGAKFDDDVTLVLFERFMS